MYFNIYNEIRNEALPVDGYPRELIKKMIASFGEEGDHFLSLITFVTKVINAIINNPNWIKSLNLTIEILLSTNSFGGHQ